MRCIKLFTLGLALTVLGACSDASTRLAGVDDAAFARGGRPGGDGGGLQNSECGGKTDLLDSRVQLTWGGAIGGDGLGNTFVGDQDGVHAKIFYHDQGCSVSGDLVFDADMNGHKVKRHVTISFPAGNDLGLGTVETAPFINFQNVMMLGADAGGLGVVDGRDAKMEAKAPGRDRNLEYPSTSAEYPGYERRQNPAAPFAISSTGIPGCDRLEFEKVRIERTSGTYVDSGDTNGAGEALGSWDPAAPGSWSIQTVANGAGIHAAQCYDVSGNASIPNGGAMDLPFSVTAVEVR